MNTSKPTLTLMCGLPRSGKTTWISKNKGDSIIISPDEIRKEMFGHQFHEPANKFVFGIAENITNILLKQGKDVILDATHIVTGLRSTWRNIAFKNKAKVRIVWVYSSKDPLKNFLYSLERNYFSPDDCKLPVEALLNMALYFTPPDKKIEGEWFEIVEWKNVHKRKLPLDKRIKIDKYDDLFSILDKWRELWHVEDVQKENKGS
jgi:predicted kinase